jgi:2-polyprenyl-6-methoxyphenol hydroxylase-like FAD-dependent oxidoreductase
VSAVAGDADVLVVGAGPTGLAVALQASAHGARVRVVERRPEPFRPSRALLVHPRTLEVLRPLGVVDELLAVADTAPAVRLHLGRRVVAARLSGLALPDTPYPHLTLVRQTDVERVLAEALTARGVPVERGVELVGLRDAGDEVRVLLRSATGVDGATCRAVAGCDGADSAVRGLCQIRWRGRAYGREVVLADVELDGGLAPGAAHVAAGREGVLFAFAIGERATYRLLATRRDLGPPPPYGLTGPPVPHAELQELVDVAGLDARITDVAWSSRVRVHHRLADHYRRGSVFLAGDAAHVNSPAGGQGMNTGIQDAVNLGWKLACAPSSSCPTALLDSYEAERRPAAKQVRALTDALFWVESARGPLPSFLRGSVGPVAAPLLPWLLDRRRVLAAGYRVVSRLDAGYGRGLVGLPWCHLQVGSRLPDGVVACPHRPRRLHELTARPGFHVLAGHDVPLGELGAHPLVHVHRLPGDRLLAVRPDGHVGFRGTADDVQGLCDWLRWVGALPEGPNDPGR